MKIRYSKKTGVFYPLDINYAELPADIQEVSQDDYRAAMARPDGHSFSFDANGVLTIAPPPPPQVDDVRAALISAIRRDAGQIIADVTQGLATEYQIAKDDAEAFKAAGYAGAVPPSVQSWANAKIPAQSAQWAADDILAAAANWLGAQSQIRSKRLELAERAKVATTVDELNVVSSEWSAFVVSMRGALGV